MRSFFFLFVLLCFGKCSLLAQESGNQRPGEGMITVKEYAAFLQAIASASQERGGSLVSMEATPINDLYEGKMVINGGGASLLRSGAVGNERYEVVGEEEEAPISFLSWRDAACYGAWKKSTARAITWDVLGSDERAAAVDTFLKSNRLTFRIVDAGGTIHQESLPGAAAEMSGMLEDLTIISIGLAGVGGVRSTEVRQTPAVCLSPEALRERQEIEGAIFTHAMVGRGQRDWDHHYQEADQEWMKAEKVWDERTRNQREMEDDRALLQRARKHLEEEEELRAGKDTEKTRLGKLARWMGKAATVLSYIPEPHLQLVSTGFAATSSGFDSLNQHIANTPVKAAKRREKKLTKKVDNVQRLFQDAEETAPNLHEHAEEVEAQARATEMAATIEFAKTLLVPHSSNEHDWKVWSDRIAKAVPPDGRLSSFIVEHTKNDRVWMMKMVTEAWAQRIQLSEQFAKQLEEKEGGTLKKLQEEFVGLSNLAKEARRKADVAQEALEKATQTRVEAEARLEAMNEELSDLKSQRKVPQLLNDLVQGPTIDKAIPVKRKEVIQAKRALEEARKK